MEDGERPNDPVLKEIFERAANDPDKKIRRQVDRYLSAERKDVRLADRLSAQKKYPECGKCNFCGETETSLRKDFETEIPDTDKLRFALVCKKCDS